jgi:hypothetical protein
MPITPAFRFIGHGSQNRIERHHQRTTSFSYDDTPDIMKITIGLDSFPAWNHDQLLVFGRSLHEFDVWRLQWCGGYRLQVVGDHNAIWNKEHTGPNPMALR